MLLCPLHWSFILYQLPSAYQVVHRLLPSVFRFYIQDFGITGKTFMNPIICRVVYRNIIAKPFVGTFVNEYKVEEQTHSAATPVFAHIAILILIAISHGRLVFHA